jgi:HSP20 family molecular chaperone IbpA
LPTKVIADEVVAEFKNGVLKIILPKDKRKKPRKVKVAKK